MSSNKKRSETIPKCVYKGDVNLEWEKTFTDDNKKPSIVSYRPLIVV